MIELVGGIDRNRTSKTGMRIEIIVDVRVGVRVAVDVRIDDVKVSGGSGELW